MSTLTHSDYMTKALQLAERGRYTVSPNPMVGCVIVNQGEIVGQGYHIQAGGPHAEMAALQEAGEKARGAIAYVTLEPCCHHGKTPPCTDALINAGIRKVVAACKDPNPLVAGKGLTLLQAAGMEVECGLHAEHAIALNEIFFHFMRTQKPFVIAKWAMSLDGKTVTHDEDARDISSPASRTFSHQTRQQVDAILIGANTAIKDNPALTARYSQDILKQPLRIVVTSKGDLPLNLKLFDLPGKTLVAATQGANVRPLMEKNIDVFILPADANNKVDVNALLIELGKRNISSLLVEGGMTIVHDFFDKNLVNKVHVYLAPVIIGALKKKKTLKNIKLSTIHTDYFITADEEPDYV
jgi:diaminohydroxyphosphoribosylaminopyrimidine deaminase/5-amino-6-(5-phosphoribosylamino)uracil reductase